MVKLPPISASRLNPLDFMGRADYAIRALHVLQTRQRVDHRWTRFDSERRFQRADVRSRGGDRPAGRFGEVYCAFWKEEPSLRQVLHMVDAEEIYVVPNFISEGYFTRTVIPRELELDGPLTGAMVARSSTASRSEITRA